MYRGNRVARFWSTARLAAGVVLIAMAVPATAVADTFTASVTFARPLPTTVDAANPLPAQLNFRETFTELDFICFNATFGADNPLDVGEGFIVGAPSGSQSGGYGF